VPGCGRWHFCREARACRDVRMPRRGRCTGPLYLPFPPIWPVGGIEPPGPGSVAAFVLLV